LLTKKKKRSHRKKTKAKGVEKKNSLSLSKQKKLDGG